MLVLIQTILAAVFRIDFLKVGFQYNLLAYNTNDPVQEIVVLGCTHHDDGHKKQSGNKSLHHLNNWLRNYKKRRHGGLLFFIYGQRNSKLFLSSQFFVRNG